mgnify:FL=1
MNENAKQKATAADVIAHRGAILQALASHIGEPHAIGMGELYELVYGESWRNRINDTRPLRKIITDLRKEGVPINSVASAKGGGYYYAAAGSELAGYLRRNKVRALKILKINAQIMKISMPDYLGQMKFDMEGSENEAA